ncbi:hypothetical protein M0805_003354 [Coniferiporia weirii]|nr:hypothetical protein M0805_003354 [Coniferiporia weirii]
MGLPQVRDLRPPFHTVALTDKYPFFYKANQPPSPRIQTNYFRPASSPPISSATTPTTATTDVSTPGTTATSVINTDTTASSVGDTGATTGAATTSGTETESVSTGSDTTAETTPTQTSPPTSQATSQTTDGGESTQDSSSSSDQTVSTAGDSESTQASAGTSQTDSSAQNTQPTDTTSGVTSDVSSAPSSSSSATTTSPVSSNSSSSIAPASTSSVPTSTTDSTSSSQSSSATQSPSSSSPSSATIQSTDSSSSSSTTPFTPAPSITASGSLSTSFTEIVTVVDGKVVTTFSPVATLNVMPISASSSAGKRTAIIVGSAVGGVAVILACLTIVYCFCYRRKRALDRAHRYVPTPRSMLFAGEDEFNPAGPRPPRRLGIFGTFRRDNGATGYHDVARDAGNSRDLGLGSPEMRELEHEPPPRLLRPVASKTGSYFQEAVWPPPGAGSRISDPLMAASHVDLTGIVDDVMGPGSREDGPPGAEAGPSNPTGSPSRPARLRGGSGDDTSILSESDYSFDHAHDYAPPHAPWHEISHTMSSVGSLPESAWHHRRDSSVNSASGLIAHFDGHARHSQGSSTGGSPWLPPGAAMPHGRVVSPTSPLRVVTDPASSTVMGDARVPSPISPRSVNNAAQETRRSLVLTNPDAQQALSDETHSQHAPSLSISPTSTQRLHGVGDSGVGTPYTDNSEVDPRSRAPSAWGMSHAHERLVDAGSSESHGTRESQVGKAL